MTFFKELIIISRRKWPHIEERYKSKNVDEFSLSQKVRFVYK